MFSSRKSAAPSSGYNLTKSLRFRRSASAYLNRTFSSPTSGTKWTISYWAKLGIIDRANHFAPNLSTNEGSISIESDFALYVNARVGTVGGAGTNYVLATTQVFRDPSAWYHIVVALDTTQATASNRVKVYVNGTQVTAFSTANYPPQNSTPIMGSAVSHAIGRVGESGYEYYYDGLFGEMNYVDGQALTPSSFGETSTTTGVWIPKKYTGTYGTNGFYLDFEDTSSTAALGYDAAGSNDWTVNGISLTAGSTYDSMNDVPTLTSATTANYCVLNPLSNSYTGTAIIGITDGNLNFSDSTSTSKTAIGSMTASTGKWYFEMTSSSTGTYAVGLYDKVSNAGSFYRNNGAYSSSFGGGGTSGYSSWGVGDVIGVAWDADAGKLWFAKNNTWQSGDPSTGTSPTNTFTAGLSLFADIYTDNSAGTKSGSFNFGQRPFAYTPPTGFNRLNTYNLPTPTIGATASTTANKYFDATLYTGNGSSSQVITNSGSMQPDFLWAKARSNAQGHSLIDSVRGTTSLLQSNSTAAQATLTDPPTFNSNGFTSTPDLSTNGYTYVAWQWRASNATAVTNTAGSITSTVSANTTAGFSIVTYTGNGTGGATVGHGLGVTPNMVIVKERTNDNGEWFTYHSSFSATQYLTLNSTDALITETTVWNNTAPSSTVFTIGSSDDINGSSDTYVAYCFSQVAGYSAFGSYTGNGSSDGVFVYLGFRPRWIMIKKTSAAESWVIDDSSRSPYNVTTEYLLADSSGAAGNVTLYDFLSNGFKPRGTSQNGSGATFIYMAFAENPFKYANAR